MGLYLTGFHFWRISQLYFPSLYCTAGIPLFKQPSFFKHSFCTKICRLPFLYFLPDPAKGGEDGKGDSNWRLLRRTQHLVYQSQREKSSQTCRLICHNGGQCYSEPDDINQTQRCLCKIGFGGSMCEQCKLTSTFSLLLLSLLYVGRVSNDYLNKIRHLRNNKKYNRTAIVL